MEGCQAISVSRTDEISPAETRGMAIAVRSAAIHTLKLPDMLRADPQQPANGFLTVREMRTANEATSGSHPDCIESRYSARSHRKERYDA
jgi:hypothetical protein